MRWIAMLCSLASFLGCRPAAPEPRQPGVSVALAYPVLLIGQGSLDVRDSQAALISIRGASSLNLNERQILDADGRLFKVTRAAAAEGQPSPMWDMGTRDRLFVVDLVEQRRPTWEQVQALVLEQVRSPTSVWAGDERAIRRVRELRDARSLIEASREAWSWVR